MSPAAQAVLAEWSPPIAIDITILLTVLLYLRGWLALRRASPSPFDAKNLIAFFAGLLSLWVAIGSPLAAFDESSLSVHMVQHILLMLVVPPLTLRGAPALPLLHGLPQSLVRVVLGPLFRWLPLQALGKCLTHPLTCWVVAAVALIAWHVPALFDLALRSDGWHDVEHACFLFSSVLFWWPVVQPFPSEPRWPRWSIPLYLFLGMFPGSALAAFLTFSDRVLYPFYLQTPPVLGISPLQDQILAGALMWVVGLLACLFPAVFLTVRLLSPRVANASDALSQSSIVSR